MSKEKTIHTGRTMMFAELSKIMDHAIQDDLYFESLKQNVAGKKTKSNQGFTNGKLRKIYSFDLNYMPFRFFKHYWQISGDKDKPILTILYALGEDFLLAESIDRISSTKIGDKVSVESLEENIETNHPGIYSDKTRKSAAQNIASSWKQAGYITGKVKNIRTQPQITFYSVAFAFLLAYCNGERGDFILKSKWAKALCLGDTQLRELAVEAARRDLLQYQFAGNVTSISFTNLFKKLEIDGF